METSCCLVLVPHLVNLEDADDGSVQKSRFEALNRGWASITRPWEKLTRNSGYGDPRKATAEKGRRYIEIVSDRLSQFIKQLSDSKMDEKFPY
jgi:creatinine amidohydrolase